MAMLGGRWAPPDRGGHVLVERGVGDRGHDLLLDGASKTRRFDGAGPGIVWISCRRHRHRRP